MSGKAAVEDRERRRARNAGSSAGKSKVRKRPAVSEDGQERPKKRRPVSEDGQERPKKRRPVSEDGQERPKKRRPVSENGQERLKKRRPVSEDGQERPKKRRPIPEDGQERPKKRPQKAEKISRIRKAGGTAGSKKSADKTQAKKTCRIDDPIIDDTWDSRNCRSISVEEVQSVKGTDGCKKILWN